MAQGCEKRLNLTCNCEGENHEEAMKFKTEEQKNIILQHEDQN